MKQNKKRAKRSHPVHAPTGKKLGFLGFVLSFAILGGIILFFQSRAAIVYQTDPQHKAQCMLNAPSKTVVRPGEQFTAKIQIKNVGTSSFNKDYGFGLLELRDGPSIWNPSGTNLSSVIGPGKTATFNLGVRAPSSPGNYSFNWGMAIALKGFVRNACTGKTITVKNPPSVSLKVNGKSGNISLRRGNSLSLSWSASNSPTSCRASGTWGGSKPASGSENRSGDTRTTGTKSYTLSCSSEVGTSTITRVVSVTNPPSSGGGGSSTPAPRPSSGGGGSTTPRPSGTSNPVAAPIPPPTPTNFSALLNEDSAVQLSWELPEYFGALSGYSLERSIDNENWERVGPESLTDQAYTDTTTDFQTTYYYRVQAVEASGLKSDFATVETTTGEFVSNLEEEGTTLTSDDQSVSVFIPKDAIEEEASCNLYNNNDVLPPAEDKYVTLTGPYDILCKNKDGNLIESFKVPVEVTVTENTDYKGIRYYAYEEENWQEVTPERAENIAKFTLQDQTTFTGIGQEKSTPLWLKILIGLFIVVGLILGVLLLLNIINRIKQRNQYESQSEDYYRKEHGY